MLFAVYTSFISAASFISVQHIAARDTVFICDGGYHSTSARISAAFSENFLLFFPSQSLFLCLSLSPFSKRWSQLVHLSRRNGHTRMCVRVVQRIYYILWFVCFFLYKHFFLSYIRQRLWKKKKWKNEKRFQFCPI